jgi:hypothetical protein
MVSIKPGSRQLADIVTTNTDRGGTTITLDFPLTTRR